MKLVALSMAGMLALTGSALACPNLKVGAYPLKKGAASALPATLESTGEFMNIKCPRIHRTWISCGGFMNLPPSALSNGGWTLVSLFFDSPQAHRGRIRVYIPQVSCTPILTRYYAR